ncbi:uncharacterized protein LOC120283997 [Dioscorea cayenensis subsp. rotundata]|uniref:Uncharacterized protein LOC120283997 n=1 Tax=Dioscorea cayennensis subsp. rotundata TaxID=55577 RepID=A0AB40D5R6_DIOCR|nr:uncharacterized protein LOC120283997 [Dioscorea cayenensis subsp. rotundata]
MAGSRFFRLNRLGRSGSDNLGKRKTVSENISQKKKATKKSKRKSFSDPKVEVSLRPKIKKTKAVKQGERKSSTSGKGKNKIESQASKLRDEDKFPNKASKKMFKTIDGRGVIAERVIDEVAFKKYGLSELLKGRSLYKSATFAQSYSLSLVHEFYSKGISKVYILGKWIPFTPTSLNRFLDFKSEVKGNYEEGLELNEDVLKEIVGRRTESWEVELRLSASLLTAKYNVLFRFGILNWLPTPHNSSILKELALLRFAVVIGKKFNLGRLIFQNIVKELIV